MLKNDFFLIEKRDTKIEFFASDNVEEFRKKANEWINFSLI